MTKLRYIFTLITVLLMTVGNVWAITPSTPSKDASGVYQIGTAEELWGFAQGVNNGTIAVSANAVLTCETSIDLGGSANGSFPGIGNSSKKYTGTFDGNGKTIRGFYRATNTNVTGTGFFNYTNTGAVIRNFTLEGEMVLTSTNSIYGVGTVAGLPTGTTFEDITSSVALTLISVPSGARIFGGLFGRVTSCTVNRCRYNGTIDASGSTAFVDRLGGIAGDGNSTFNNCLFDGEIIVGATTGLKVAGILVAPNNPSTINNSLFAGKITFPAGATLSTNCGPIAGNGGNNIAVSQSYYWEEGITKDGVKASGYLTTGGTAVGSTPWSTITDNLNGGVSVTNCNWKVVAGQDYPIPMAWTKSQHTITFKDYDGTTLATKYVEQGGTLTLPSNPSRTGYTFTGWSPEVVMQPTGDATYIAQYSVNQYTITFNTDGGTAIAAITQDYNTAITAPANPTKTGYTFAGWSEEIPSTMPAANKTITATWTINQYTITFDTKGGTAIAAIKQNYNTAITAPADPTREGYTFAGWNEAIPATMPAENKTITATWNINQYDVRYYVGGALYHTDTYDYNAAVTPLAAPEKARYTFSGWSTIPSTMPANNVEVNGTFSYAPNAAGVYEIGNKEDLVNFITVTNTNKTANAQLIADVNLNGEIVSAISDYKGTFDGQGYKIKGYAGSSTATSTAGTGFFNSTNGATIQDLVLEGTFSISGASNNSAYIGCLVGIATSTTLEDVTVSVAMTTDETADGATQDKRIRILGGIVGAIRGGTMNRCRYNGTMTFNASNDKIGDRFGGLVGLQQTTASTISNCLFDGTMTVQQPSIIIGGIVGQGFSGSKVQNCLFAGTMTQTSGNANCGPIMGSTTSTSVSTTYYELSGFNYTSQYNAAGTARGTNTWTTIHQALGTGNWVSEDGKVYPVPGEQSGEHVHNYVNGFCTGMVGHCDARREQPTLEGGIYKIANAGQLFYFTDQYNAGAYPAAAQALLTADIDLEGSGRSYPGLGTNDHKFAGTFDGDGHAITNFYRSVSGNYNGFFNQVENATIRNFSLAGTMIVNGTGQQIGSVIGVSTGTTTVEDVHSSVDVTITSTAAQVGGFVGRPGGTYNRCSYSGTVSANTAYDKIGGFAGSLRESTMQYCLVDGQLQISTSNANLKAGGFAGSVIEVASAMSNCLVNGTINITNTTANCGIVMGLVDRNITFSNILYTTTNTSGLKPAVGTVTSAYKLTGKAEDVTTGYTWDEVNIMLNPTAGTTGNWQIIAGKDYPQPKAGEWNHVHTYHNGFCISEDGNYEPAEKGTDGYYQVTNGGQLWWLATNINDSTLQKNTRIKLMNDIDLEGDKHGSFPGICPLGSNMIDGAAKDDWTTAFQGIFNGQGYAIHNYYRTISTGIRKGLIDAADNATIKNFSIDGEFILVESGTESALVGAVLGSAHGNTTVEDITSSVNITSANARGLGGVVGALEDQAQQADVTMNRCRYNGTITLTGAKQNSGIGGLVGELRSAIVKNCLFDGTITAAAGVSYKSVGGLVGRVGTNNNSEIHRCLAHGTITLADYTADKKSGIVMGEADRTIYFEKIYHTTNNTGTLPVTGPHTVIKSVKDEDTGVSADTEVDMLLGASYNMTNNDTLYNGKLRLLLGESNWAYVEPVSGNYNYPKKDTEHIHKFSNGFCIAGDGEYEVPSHMGATYQIDNGGKLYWFAEHFNAGDIDENASVEIMNNILMEGDKYTFPGIGTSSHKFKGTFNGHGYQISGYHRDVINAEGTGFINYADQATIKNFGLYGDVRFNLATTKSFHGTIVGMATGANTLIEDVTSFVNVTINNAYVRVFGGIAGRSSGTMNRCRFSGTIESPTAGVAMTSGRQIAGICANAKEALVISNCLFDGTIRSHYSATDTMRVSGILASNEKNCGVTIIIKNCLFNGCLDLQHNYIQGTHGTGVKCTENGLISGYWDSNLPSVIDNVITIKQCPDLMGTVPNGHWKTDPKVNSVTEIDRDDVNWTEILDQLNEHKDVQKGDSINWKGTDTGGPTPNGHQCPHVHDESYFNQFGWCTVCGARRDLRKDEDGRYIMEYISDLAGFRDLINSGTAGSDEFNAKLTNDIDFQDFDGDFGEPIGNSHFNRYLYNFDGQGYSLLNVRITADNEYVGFFGFAGDPDHDCEIHDFTITGTIEVPYDSKKHDDKPLYMGVVGKMYRGRIYNVHSELTMKNTNATKIKLGGILGGAETQDNAHSVIVQKCSYSGTATINAVGNMGGIVGETSKNTRIEDCSFTGTLNHVYQGENNTTQFGGILGYNEETSFAGIANCMVAGVLKTEAGRVFVDYNTAGNHKNVLTGYDTEIGTTKTHYQNNYSLNAYAADPIVAASLAKPTFVTPLQFMSGDVCAALNGSRAAAPWGQILGYQCGGYFTEGTPAMQYPMPGWTQKRACYPITKSGTAYTAAYYYFDDAGDETLFPTDATSMRVKKISYTRDGASYMQGYISVCFPFELRRDNGSLPQGTLFNYDHATRDGDGPNNVTGVYFADRLEQDFLPAGTPCFLKLDAEAVNQDWIIDLENASGFPLVLAPVRNRNNESNATPGIYGSYNTVTVGTGKYKLSTDGTQLLYTTASSHCYPYRTYVKLSDEFHVQLPGAAAPKRVPAFYNYRQGVTTGTETNFAGESAHKYIEDNQVMIEVNGRKYNANGLLLK